MRVMVPNRHVSPRMADECAAASNLVHSILVTHVAHVAQNAQVMFSDLHVSPRTVDVCVEVLKTVHREACARNAGILFLGGVHSSLSPRLL